MVSSKKVRIENQQKALQNFILTKFPLGEIRKYTIDSVHEDAFSVEISRLVKERPFTWNEFSLAKFEYWEPLEVDENDGWIRELPFIIPYEKVREGMVFVVAGETVIEITDLVREQSKILYSSMLAREHNSRRTRSLE